MTQESFKRKLAAGILSADVEGYSRLKGVRYMYGCFHTVICITAYGCLSKKMFHTPRHRMSARRHPENLALKQILFSNAFRPIALAPGLALVPITNSEEFP